MLGSEEVGAGGVSVRELRLEGATQQRVGVSALQALMAERFGL